MRVALGFGLGWPVGYALGTIAREPTRLGVSPVTLVATYVVLRWLEWSFVGAMATGEWRQARSVLVGKSRREHAWRLGGVALSFLTDAADFLGIGVLGMGPF